MKRLTLLITLSSLVHVCMSAEPNPSNPRQQLEASLARTGNIGNFGEELVNHLRTEALYELKQSAAKAVTVSLQFTVRASLPTVPGPREVDVCWEICPSGHGSFLQCYVECSGPGFSIGPIRQLRTCADIRRDLANADNAFEQRSLMLEFIKRACLTRKEKLHFAPAKNAP